MRHLILLAVLLLAFSCNDDDSFSPNESFDCNDIAENWSAVSGPSDHFQYAQDIAFSAQGVAVSVSRGGQIMRSTDGGRTWVLIESNLPNSPNRAAATTTAWLRTVERTGDNLFYASGYDEDAFRFDGDIETDAVFLTSNDGGQEWSKRYLDGFKAVFDLRFTNTNLGYAIASPNERIEGESNYQIIRTEDGGDNWATLPSPHDPGGGLKRFIDRPGEVCLLAETEAELFVLLTLNPVTNEWEENSLPTGFANDVQFVSSDFALANISGELWSTADGGTNWTLRNTDDAMGFSYFFAADEENYLLIKRITQLDPDAIGGEELLNYEVFETQDGGSNWSSRTVVKECDYELQYQVRPIRTPDNGFLTVTSRANLIRFNG